MLLTLNYVDKKLLSINTNKIKLRFLKSNDANDQEIIFDTL